MRAEQGQADLSHSQSDVSAATHAVDMAWVPAVGRHLLPRRAVAEAEQAAKVRRRRVLEHRDIAERLIRAPLRYSRPEVWNGYIPPATGPYGAKLPDRLGLGDGVDDAHNASPQRVALIEILKAVLEREQSVSSQA